MADSSVAITAGSGTAIDTRTEATNGNHRQVVVLGDPSTNAGLATVDATAGLKVDLGADNDVTAVGTVAHDSPDAGSPLKVGAKAETSPKGITLVADADRTDLLADADGMLMVKLNTSGADIVSERVSNTDGNATAFTNFSAVASTKNYITSISIHNASSTNGYVDFRDGAAGAVLWTMSIPANGGSIISSPVPLFKTTANTALAFDVSAALTTVYISVSGYQSKV